MTPQARGNVAEWSPPRTGRRRSRRARADRRGRAAPSRACRRPPDPPGDRPDGSVTEKSPRGPGGDTVRRHRASHEPGRIRGTGAPGARLSGVDDVHRDRPLLPAAHELPGRLLQTPPAGGEAAPLKGCSNPRPERALDGSRAPRNRRRPGGSRPIALAVQQAETRWIVGAAPCILALRVAHHDRPRIANAGRSQRLEQHFPGAARVPCAYVDRSLASARHEGAGEALLSSGAHRGFSVCWDGRHYSRARCSRGLEGAADTDPSRLRHEAVTVAPLRPPERPLGAASRMQAATRLCAHEHIWNESQPIGETLPQQASTHVMWPG